MTSLSWEGPARPAVVPHPTRRGISRPTVVVPLTLSALAWAALAVMARGGDGLALCIAVPGSLASGIMSALSFQLWQASLGVLALEWVLMICAMMLPLAVPQLSLFCARLYRPMQRPALLAAMAGFVGVWCLAGLIAVPLMLALRAVAFAAEIGVALPLLAYGVAITWSYSGPRARALRKCHAVPVVHGRGASVYRSALGYGARLGGLCLITCGAAMTAPMLGGQGLLAMALVTHVLLTERLRHRPARGMTALPLVMIGALGMLI